MANRIQRFELNDYYHVSIHCPFCGQKVVNADAGDGDGQPLDPCPDTLFIATDEGLEYSTKLFEQNIGIEGLSSDRINLPDGGWDGLTDQVTVTDSIKFATYVGAPSFFGAYIGFGPGGQVSENAEDQKLDR